MKNDDYSTVQVPTDLHYKFKVNAAIEGLPIRKASEIALYDWIAKVEKRRYAAINSKLVL